MANNYLLCWYSKGAFSGQYHVKILANPINSGTEPVSVLTPRAYVHKVKDFSELIGEEQGLGVVEIDLLKQIGENGMLVDIAHIDTDKYVFSFKKKDILTKNNLEKILKSE